jgi:hypothetical protein
MSDGLAAGAVAVAGGRSLVNVSLTAGAYFDSSG